MKDRREVYEEYCRDVGRARRLGKTTVAESKKQDPERDYKALLREEVTSTRTRWDDFRKKWKRERRFYSFGRDDKDREKAFKTHLKELGERQSCFSTFLASSGTDRQENAPMRKERNKISSTY
jgi:transcription elongation regulator 1